MRTRILISLLAVTCAAALSCNKDGDFDLRPGGGGSSSVTPRTDIPEDSFDKVFLMVSGGYNDLNSYITEDQRDMREGYLPGCLPEEKDVMVVLSRLKWANVTAPVLYRMSRMEDGSVRCDTLHRWATDMRLFDADVIHDAMQMVHNRFPARSYGMAVSSHATGWMPEKFYYYNRPPGAAAAVPARRSIGQDGDGAEATELDVQAFINAIPYKLDYLLLDCCLCGGVEVAWGLRGKADLLGFSQTEILADGFDYKKIGQRLLGGSTPDARAVCEDYFAQYDNPSGSATISLIDTREMDDLADVCAALFSKYRTALDHLDGSEDWEGWKVQGYFRYERHYFYDLEDIFLKVGITGEEHAQLTAALNRCVLYKAHTEWFMRSGLYGFPITIHSGFSMYLPSMGTEYLDNYYKENIAWNQATHLVQ